MTIRHQLEIALFPIAYFGIPIFFCYLPYFIACLECKRSKKQFDNAMKALDESKIFEKSAMAVLETRPLGLGEEPHGTITFEQALKNQTLATKSVLYLMA